MPLVNSNKAVQQLFGVDGKELRSKANSYLRNGTIPSSLVVSEGFFNSDLGIRGKKLLKSQAVDCLFNALVLDAFFNDTKYVKEIFDSEKTRIEATKLCEEILLKAQSVDERAKLTSESQLFLIQLSDAKFGLREKRVTSPFKEQRLPQMDIANTGLLYHLLRSQRLALSHKESLLLCLLENDLAGAVNVADQIDSALIAEDHLLAALVMRVRQDLQEAQSFSSLLNILPD
ncbi:hypothetical protein ACEQ7L_002757 [Vibrio fluvialis]|uniref:hypothetical protein n=1 Tax=Vibrio fluvialis TaxID=676 RepID=UPI001EEBA92F|nr:hypothetical protein [Vibrio fluvialis]EKO3382279.1 hypothetical protein [Vibrio fluvialis]MCG6373391.1 hypothetical protein [Vibrio fluvialis]